MTDPSATDPAAAVLRWRFGTVAALLLAPLAGLAILIFQPKFDIAWEHHPAHFWLVVSVGAINAVLAYATGTAARLRSDARLLLVSLAFLAAAGFLALHALATPGVLLATPNPGFTLATPVGLFVASVFAAASSLRLGEERARAVVRHGAWLLWGLALLMVLWATASLARFGPLGSAAVVEGAPGWLVVIAIAGLLLYAFSVFRYLRLPRQSASPLPVALAAAFTLLAEAEFALIWGRNWHASWWAWHVLMLAAFVVIAVFAQRSWREERWAGLYRPETTAAERPISVIFADVQGFTSFSEVHSPQEVTQMLNAYFTAAIPPIVERFGGQIDRLIGDALMATFNLRGDQPDHAQRAAGAALALQVATGAVADAHPGWPRFRAGINTGVATVGVVGTGGGRTYTAIGDVVNVAARLEGAAPVGGVVISGDTLAALSGASADPLGMLPVKGRTEPVEAHRLLALDSRKPGRSPRIGR